ncbi:MAG: transketolase [Dehalococcoidia bacterium]|nr:transketolase [Dehalococcoidia bacterium]
MLEKPPISDLQQEALDIRRHVIGLAAEHLCHVGGALSAADILAALYFRVMRIDPAAPASPDRDYLILSKGHGVLALYAALAGRGLFPVETLASFEQTGSMFAGHPTLKVPGVEVATGSLGHGLPVGVGIALALKTDGDPNRVFVLMGDGELQEGSVWEAAMAAPRLRLDNLVAIVDRNRFQAFGAVEEIMPLEPLADKWRSFRWDVVEVDGHDMSRVVEALERSPAKDVPRVIIASTVKGKGAPCIEDTPRAHFTKLTPEEAEEALRALGVTA